MLQPQGVALQANNSLLISMCILKDLPQQKNPRVLCWGNSPNFISSHIPMEMFLFYETGKKLVNKKRVAYEGERFQYSCILLRFGNTLGAHDLGCAFLRRTHS